MTSPSVLLLCVCCLIGLSNGFPQYQGFQGPDPDNPLLQAEDVQDVLFDNTDDELPPVRQKRLTCDLFSFESQWVTPNHSACAMRCLAQFWKYKGGRCVNGKCQCSRHG